MVVEITVKVGLGLDVIQKANNPLTYKNWGSGLSSDRKEQIFNYELLHAIYFEDVDLGAVLYQVLMIIDFVRIMLKKHLCLVKIDARVLIIFPYVRL